MAVVSMAITWPQTASPSALCCPGKYLSQGGQWCCVQPGVYGGQCPGLSSALAVDDPGKYLSQGGQWCCVQPGVYGGQCPGLSSALAVDDPTCETRSPVFSITTSCLVIFYHI